MLENLEFAEISPIWNVYTEMFIKFVFDSNPLIIFTKPWVRQRPLFCLA